jgi:hypothetical protein
LQHHVIINGMIPGSVQLQLAGPGNATAAAAGVENAPEWSAVAPAAAAAAGEQPLLQQLLEMCQQVYKGLDSAAAVMSACMDEPQALLLLSLQQLGQQLQELGTAVCAALPVRFCCNNVRCMWLAGLSEQQQVAGRKNICSGCKVAR